MNETATKGHTLHYIVEYVRELPCGQRWAMARTDHATYLFILEGEVTPSVLEEAWAAFRWLSENRPAPREDVPEVIPDDPNRALCEAVRWGHSAT